MVQGKTPSYDDVRVTLEGVREWLEDDSTGAPRPLIAHAVRGSARLFAAEHPGGSVELRIPPFVAVQCVAGPDHRRGTPPNVVEMQPRTWLLLATGRLTWAKALKKGLISASGSRADLSEHLPIDGLCA